MELHNYTYPGLHILIIIQKYLSTKYLLSNIGTTLRNKYVVHKMKKSSEHILGKILMDPISTYNHQDLIVLLSFFQVESVP